MTHHFTPQTNDKRKMSKDDFAGWYQITRYIDSQLISDCRWWNGAQFNHRPNMRRGWTTEEMGDIRGIVHLIER